MAQPNVQPDLFGGAAIVGASRSVQQQEGAQCVGQTDVYALLRGCSGDEAPKSYRYYTCDGCGLELQRHNSTCCTGYGSTRRVGY